MGRETVVKTVMESIVEGKGRVKLQKKTKACCKHYAYKTMWSGTIEYEPAP